MLSDAPVWDPVQYNRFQAQRDRPAFDLLLRLPEDLAPREIWDVGCGTGHHAAMLKRRWPDAAVHGLDSSAAMLNEARALPDAVEWIEGDLTTWAPSRPVDLMLANASLQWAPDHRALFATLCGGLASGGVLAVQMPLAWETRHHALMRQTASEGVWRDRLRGVDTIAPLLDPDVYYDVLAKYCDDIDIWSTTYLQVLDGENAVLEWMKGTALRPYLSALEGDAELSAAFLSSLSARLGAAFPRRPDGVTLLPFPRLFLTARRR